MAWTVTGLVVYYLYSHGHSAMGKKAP
jgi:hypothetical protein